jgi:hypothetical protein
MPQTPPVDVPPDVVLEAAAELEPAPVEPPTDVPDEDVFDDATPVEPPDVVAARVDDPTFVNEPELQPPTAKTMAQIPIGRFMACPPGQNTLPGRASGMSLSRLAAASHR